MTIKTNVLMRQNDRNPSSAS